MVSSLEIIGLRAAVLPRATRLARFTGRRGKIPAGLLGLQVVRESGHELVTVGQRGAGFPPLVRVRTSRFQVVVVR